MLQAHSLVSTRAKLFEGEMKMMKKKMMTTLLLLEVEEELPSLQSKLFQMG